MRIPRVSPEDTEVNITTGHSGTSLLITVLGNTGGWISGSLSDGPDYIQQKWEC